MLKGSAMHRLVAFAFVALIGFAHAADKGEQWAFLMEGDYHGDEAPANPGKGWLALVIVDGRWHLVLTKVRAEPVYDAVLDEKGQKTGIRISSRHPKALALFRDPDLLAQKIDTPNLRFKGSSLDLSPDQPLKVSFKGQHYQIVVVRSEIFLTNGSRRTKLPDLSVSEDRESEHSESARLLWAGDLDRDGSLDLLVSYSRYNASGTCLFLSSKAPKGNLVRQVACHGGVGC
jgi:hypothetical protein